MDGRIRMVEEADVPTICDIYAPAVLENATSFELELPSEAEMARRVENTLASHPWFVFERDDRVEGYAYGSRFRVRAAYRWSCEVSVYVAEAAQGRGLGKRLYEALFVFLRAQGYRQAYAGITLPNDASVALHERVGFESVGVFRDVGFKFGSWHDVGWWQRPLSEGGGEGEGGGGGEGGTKGEPAPIVSVENVASGFAWGEF